MLVSAPAAFADVTAADVWSQWKDYAGRSGQTISVGSEDQSGNTLTLTDLKLSMQSPELSFAAAVGDVVLTENGDGTVSIAVPEQYPVEVHITPENETPVQLNFLVSKVELALTASGTPDAISYALSADKVAVALDSFEAPDAEDASAAFTLTLNSITGNYSLGSGDLQPFTSAVAASTVDLALAVTGPSSEGGGTLKVNGTLNDLSSESTGKLPNDADMADIGKAVAAGFVVDGKISYGAANYDIDFQDPTDNFTATAKLGSGGGAVAMNADGMSYSTNASDLDVTMSGSSIPIPQIALQMAEAAFGLSMPLTKSDDAKPMGLLVRMVEFSVNDEIWGMIDPGGALPHDPATLIVDLSGAMNWLIDITSPDADESMGDAMPAKVQSLDINQFQAKAVGADLTGTGAFTFDNDDLTTWGGMPAPDGKIDLKLVGGNALLDTLVSMGLVPQDQAMGAKMMIGMFTKPGDGPDTLTSTIEVKKSGSIFANGQQIK